MTKKKLILKGPFLTQSGYGVHARQIARWAFDKLDNGANIDLSFSLTPWGNTPWLVNTSFQNGMIGRIVQHAKKTDDKIDYSIQVQLPNEWNPFEAQFNIGVTAGVETDICNPNWIDNINRMDLVIVPSEFTKQTFVNTATKFGKEIKTEIKVIPEAIMEEAFKHSETNMLDKEFDKLVTTKFNFLVFGQITGNNPDNDRKNFGYTMKALYEAFRDNEDVGIVVKTNSSRNTTVDKLHCMGMFSQIQQQLKFENSKGPKVYLLHGDMNDREIVDLYRNSKIKGLLSLTRGEGFGLPLLEAAACDLPIIATDWSAHTEFLNKGKWVKVDKDLIPLHQTRLDGNIFIEAARWAQPKEQDAISKLKKFYMASSTPKEWAKELGEKLRKDYCFKSISNQYDETLKENIPELLA